MASNKLGHVMLVHKGKFYFIPAEKIGPPIELTKPELVKINGYIKKLKEEEPGNFIETAIGIDENAHLIRICRRNG